MINLVWSAGFVRKFKRLIRKNPQLRSQVEKVLQLLTEDPFDSSLRTHKLKGDLDGVWSCSIDYDNRILFEFVTNSDSGEEDILLLTVGSHDDVY
ncbi:MAG: type II toxin-antitoxin system YafQ family toxin [Nostoc sp. ChiQUE02]|uniref:type II toxin-antitoxin system RelE/ParE family toxin n=1 Tax=Nostoc sp. ChiQUE02 TaxID=3075377 RepID=UPI002AD31E15|nr:type II toxin-antitoxin system mRNA interferase toxin, RelE/StbE family [Nostoc sp. ChiQUE02]MDZ8228570.1 type II toxin-antitoxin system mRNA interferase toxin, RelE/StbE family [Nostoc sp. ChiQUE02]